MHIPEPWTYQMGIFGIGPNNSISGVGCIFNKVLNIFNKLLNIQTSKFEAQWSLRRTVTGRAYPGTSEFLNQALSCWMLIL